MTGTKATPTSPKSRPYRETPVPPPVLRWPAATGPSSAQVTESQSSSDSEDVSSQEEGEDSEETSGEDSEGEPTSEESSPTQSDHSHRSSDNDNSSDEEESEGSVAFSPPQAQQPTPGQTTPQIHTPTPASSSFFAKLPATLSTTSSSSSSSSSYTSAIPPIDPEDPTQAKMDSNRPAGMSEEEYQEGLKQFDIEKASLQDLIKQREIMKFRMKGTDAVIDHLEKKLGWNNGKSYGENMEELLNRLPTPPPKKVNPNKNKNKNANRRQKAKAAKEAAAAAKKQVEDWTEADMNAVEGSGEVGGLTAGGMGATQGSGDISGPENAQALNEELGEKEDVGAGTGKWKFAPYRLRQNRERVAGDEDEDVEMDG